MKISVITVCYNSAMTIGDTLRSVAEQSHRSLEHIVIDGASQDATLQVIEATHNRVMHLVSEPDHGIYDAMNKGLKLASGEIVCFLNADDVYSHTNVLERVSQAMELDGLDALYADAEFIDFDHPNRPLRRYSSAHFHPSRIAWGWMPAHPTLFLKRTLFERYGCFRREYQIAGDFELVARMFHRSPLNYQYVAEVLVRMRAGGISTGGWRNTILLNKEVLLACKANGIKTNLFMILSKYPRKILEFIRS